MKLRVLELFGGIGACTQALKRLGVDVEIADYVEIDKYAVASYNAINGTHFEPQDITEWDKDIDVDLIMHGSPCQDISLAGQQAGADEGSGTRSSLMYETIRIVKKLKPKYVIWENVKNLISKKHRHNFDNYLQALNEGGYTNYWQVLNSKDYGIPQNRERVFTISIRNDIDKGYEFPPKQELKLKLKDLLEDEVDEKYYLTDAMMNCFMSDGTGNYPRKERFLQNINRKNQDIGNAITSRAGSRPTDNFIKIKNKIKIKNANSKGYDEATEGDSIDLTYPNSTTRRGRVGHQVSQTIPASDTKGVVVVGNYMPSNHEASRIVDNEGLAPTVKENHGTVTAVAVAQRKRIEGQSGLIQPLDRKYKEHGQKRQEHIEFKKDNCSHALRASVIPLTMNELRIRKLTPKECWRLMGFDDEDFEKAQKVNSNTQLYKQAGNSIVVNVLVEIFKNLLGDNTNE